MDKFGPALEALICILIPVGIIGIIFGIVWVVSKIIDKNIERKYYKILKNNPKLATLIENYKKAWKNNNNFYSDKIWPLIKEEKELRNLFSTASNSEYETYSKRVDELVIKIADLKEENDRVNNFIDLSQEITNYIYRYLNQKEIKTMKDNGWLN